VLELLGGEDAGDLPGTSYRHPSHYNGSTLIISPLNGDRHKKMHFFQCLFPPPSTCLQIRVLLKTWRECIEEDSSYTHSYTKVRCKNLRGGEEWNSWKLSKCRQTNGRYLSTAQNIHNTLVCPRRGRTRPTGPFEIAPVGLVRPSSLAMPFNIISFVSLFHSLAAAGRRRLRPWWGHRQSQARVIMCIGRLWIVKQAAVLYEAHLNFFKKCINVY